MPSALSRRATDAVPFPLEPAPKRKAGSAARTETPFAAEPVRNGADTTPYPPVLDDTEPPINEIPNFFDADAPVSGRKRTAAPDAAPVPTSRTAATRVRGTRAEDTPAPVAESLKPKKPAKEESVEELTVETIDPNAVQYRPPTFELLNPAAASYGRNSESPEEKARVLTETLESFHISARVTSWTVGPVLTRFELTPAPGVRVSRITSLSNDIALALAAPRVRIEAPIPGKSDECFTAFDGPELNEARNKAFRQIQANYEEVLEYEQVYGIRDTLKNDPTLTNQVVHTVHTSIYDLEKRELTVCVQEDVGTVRTFGLFEPVATGSKDNPWPVGTEGHESEVTAWTNGTGALVIEGVGAVGSMPWAENAAGITELVKAKGVENLEELVGSLPDVVYVNGLTSGEFMQAALGFVRAEGFSAIAVENGQATLDVVVERSTSLDESADWTPVSTNSVVVPAPGEQGFFILR